MTEVIVRTQPVAEAPTKLLALGIFQGKGEIPQPAASVDHASDGLITELLDRRDFLGRPGETALLYPPDGSEVPARRILLVGLGPADGFHVETLREAAGKAARAVQGLEVDVFANALHLVPWHKKDQEMAAQATVEASILAMYQYDGGEPKVRRMDLLAENKSVADVVQRGVDVGRLVGGATNRVRTLVNLPANLLTPTKFAEEAQQTAETAGFRCEVLDQATMANLGMRAVLGVAQGSLEPARFIVMEHRGGADGQPIILAGKGVTFDSGGISLKDRVGMGRMKYDMAGGAAVLGAIVCAAQLDLPLRVIGLVPATENLPSGGAYRPGDVVKSLSGQTIEIVSTDAEGRLLLADALSYAQRFDPRAIVDVATLTKGVRDALGPWATGVMGNDRDLIRQLASAGERTGERVWELPLWEEHESLIASDVADMKNSAMKLVGSPPGGVFATAIAGGIFLRRFVGDARWAHLDIAGTAWAFTPTRSYLSKGATGVGVRMLTQFLRDWPASA